MNVMIAEADGVVRANSYPRKYPASSPFFPSTPWTIDLTDENGRFWLGVFDLDAKRVEDFEQAAEDLGVLVRTLRAQGLPHVVCRSSPTGGFHVFLAVDGVDKTVMVRLAAAARAVLPSLDHGLLCNDRTGAVRPPGAPHAKGGASAVMDGDAASLATPTITAADLERLIAALQQLRPTVDPATQPATGPVSPTHRAHRELPAWGAAHMATLGGGGDPSRTGYLCLLAAAVAGWTRNDVEHAARTAPGMEHYRTRRNPTTGRREPRKPQEATARLDRQWEKAVARASLYRYAPQDRADKDLTELAGIIDMAEGLLRAFRVSPGRWGTTEPALHDARVLTALAWLALRSGARDTAASLRTVADAAGMASTTVDRSLRRLQDAGFALRTRSAEGVDAAIFRVTNRFSTDPGQDGPLHDVTARPPGHLFDARSALLAELEARLDAGRHDVFTRAALGPTARRVYEALSMTARDTVAVAWLAGIPHRRVIRIIYRLKQVRLAVESSRSWRRPAHDLRDWAARKLGVDGILKRRRARHANEREQWAWWQNHLRRKAGRRGRERTGSAQTLIFQLSDAHGGPEAWPSYPCHPDGTADHHTAWEYVTAGLLQQLRDTELAA
ncbi:hypothetical protein [Microbacterium sp. MMO-78]|uniref:hypothetical protein n=2 Tax=Microbacterium TaxID=33882 RepID=UPI00301702DA